jgi:hypothetical protein
MNFQITNRFSGAVMFECELSAEIAGSSYGLRLGFAVKKAVEAGANLADAYLAGANLAGANLARANLARAYLAGANLADAYLAGANLADANLAGANLAGANLAGANLARAYLADANLARANLAGANNVPEDIGSPLPKDPAKRKAALAERAARFRERNPDVPVVENLDARLLGIIESGAGKLDMARWHGENDHWCGTTHCRAGWAIHEAGEKGKALQDKYGPERAGAMIYRASTGRVPHFFASDERALADIREQAALQA